MKVKLLILFLSVFAFSSCTKELNRQLLNAFIQFNADGKQVRIIDQAGINENIFDCVVKGDTALYIDGVKGYELIKFVVKADHITDGTYVLDYRNRGFYVTPDSKRYSTTEKSIGTITIRKSTFKAEDMLNTLEGEFSFKGEDTVAHKFIEITGGSFKMERQEE